MALGLALTASAGRAQAQTAPQPIPPTAPPAAPGAEPAPAGAPADPNAPAAPSPDSGLVPANGEGAVPPPAPSERLRADDPLQAKLADMIRKEMGAAPKLVEFHGYFRAGFSSNSKGGDADAFQAPGAYSKFRLGNEVETYGEIELDNNWVNPDHNDVWFKTVTMLAVVAPRNNTFDTPTAFAVREAYGQAGHIIPGQPEMSFWAGSRYYRRRDSHIIDFFYQDTSGYGGGFEDLKLGGKLKLAVAYFGGSRELNAGEVTNIGRPAKNMFDLRLYDIPVGKGSLELWAIPTFAVSGSETADQSGNRSGMGGGVFYFLPFMGGFNEASLEFGYGGSANFSPSIETIAHDGWMFRFVDRATIQATPNISLTWSGVFQLDNKNGDAPNADGTSNSSAGNMWISAGARPIYNFTKYIGLALDGGLDIVKPETPGSKYGELVKFALAPTIRPGMDFWARPEIRVFVTFAKWSDSIKGAVGGDAFKNQTYGLTSGVQFESWW